MHLTLIVVKIIILMDVEPVTHINILIQENVRMFVEKVHLIIKIMIKFVISLMNHVKIVQALRIFIFYPFLLIFPIY